MICEVCDQPDAEAVFHGHAMHESCAPKHWADDAADQAEFMSRFRDWWAQASQWKRNWDGTKANLRVVK